MLTTGVKFNRRELSGAFGDIGTDLPLLAGLVAVCGMDAAGVLVVFGAMQVSSGLFYGMPMPVQPLKVIAALAIAGGISASVIHGAGLAIGVIMLAFTSTGLLERLRLLVPKPAIRGIQVGLGVKLGWLALSRFLPSLGWNGWILAAICGIFVVALLGSRKCPPALPVVALGCIYAVFLQTDTFAWGGRLSLSLPTLGYPSLGEIATGFLLLTLPQIPLSLGNSLLATHQMTEDLFPERGIRIRTIGYTYSVFNLVAPFVGGVPVCHGSGGIAGHHVFGGRTGGAVVVYGAIFLIVGLTGLGEFLDAFPLPVLGVLLLTKGIALTGFARDMLANRQDLAVALLVAAVAVIVPYGFAIGLIAGTVLAKLTAVWGSFVKPRRMPAAMEVNDAI